MGRREVGGWARRHCVAADEAWRVGNRAEIVRGVKARGHLMAMVGYGIDATFV